MNIAINTLSLNRTKAGMGNYIHNLVHNLAGIDNKNQYHIFVSDRNKEFFNIKKDNFKIINLGSLVANRFLRLLWEQFSLPFYVNQNKIDVLHSPGFVLPFFSKAKNIVTIADMTFIDYPEVHTLLKRSYFRLLMPKSIKKSEKVLSISESTKKDILRLVKVDPKKIKVTHLAHGKEFHVLNKKISGDYLRKKYRIDFPYILSVGMIEPRKNLKMVFKAFLRLKKEGFPHKLVVAGKKGWRYKGIFKEIGVLGIKKDVVFMGYVPDEDLIRLYNSADLFVYPCLYEGFGIPILEAMACGCPVITSNISSMPEVAGDAALLVDPKNVDNIFSSIKKVINDKGLRKRLQRKSLSRSSKFSWENTARQTLKVYEDVGKNRSKT